MSKQDASNKTWNTALITGAGSGVGLRLAEILSQQGTEIVALDRVFSDEAKARLSASQTTINYITADITDAAALEKRVADMAAQVNDFDLVINCAGVQRAKSFAELSSDDFNIVINVNLIGTRNIAAAVLPHISNGGRLALISSLAGLTNAYGYAAYNASKWGVMGLAGTLRLEYKPKGIGVSVICPPEFDSPMVEQERQEAPALTFAMKELAGSLGLDEVALLILHGLRKGKDVIIPGRMARVTAFVARHFPNIIQSMSHKMVAKGLRAEQKS